MEETDKLLDNDKITQKALEEVEENGIVFIDEIDKITSRHDKSGGDVSREGVQRDLLPLIEGTTVSTKHGAIKTDYILFITFFDPNMAIIMVLIIRIRRIYFRIATIIHTRRCVHSNF